MLFNSVNFLIFFPIVVLAYFLLPHKVRWIWLLLASYFFYMCWNAKYVLLMALSTVITYASGVLIDRTNKNTDEAKRKKYNRLWVALSFISNLSILFFFKYFDFAIDNINALLGALGLQLLNPQFNILLPVGISFYTFQALSYTMDVYRGEIPAERNLGKYALFVSFFPQLVAGPIERSKNLLNQIHKKHTFDYTRVKNGLLLMLWGYFQKMVIADRVAILVDTVYNNYAEYAGGQLAVATLLFAVQIYCDFSGYSDIAIGAAQVMGFDLMQNFRQPYFAKSVRDFWRRWHISLSTWFRDYLYIPLGGNRRGKLRTYINTMVTFVVSGLWHGANWTFVVWGALHGAYQTLGSALQGPKNKLYNKLGVDRKPFSFRLGQALLTFVLVDFAWIFFRAPSIQAAGHIIKNIFTNFRPWVLFDGSLFAIGLDAQDFMVMAASILVLLVGNLLQARMNVRNAIGRQNLVFRWTFYIVSILVILIFGIYGPQYNNAQFIYFQF